MATRGYWELDGPAHAKAAKNKQWRKITHDNTILDLPIWYVMGSKHMRVRTVAMSSIVPTQHTVHPDIIADYVKRTRMVDADGQLPMGIRFKGSKKIYLLNGHHRYIACIEKGRKRFRLRVEDFDHTLDEALAESKTVRTRRTA